MSASSARVVTSAACWSGLAKKMLIAAMMAVMIMAMIISMSVTPRARRRGSGRVRRIAKAVGPPASVDSGRTSSRHGNLQCIVRISDQWQLASGNVCYVGGHGIAVETTGRGDCGTCNVRNTDAAHRQVRARNFLVVVHVVERRARGIRLAGFEPQRLYRCGAAIRPHGSGARRIDVGIIGIAVSEASYLDLFHERAGKCQYLLAYQRIHHRARRAGMQHEQAYESNGDHNDEQHHFDEGVSPRMDFRLHSRFPPRP